MHERYAGTVDAASAWMRRTVNVRAALVLGSQARTEHPGDGNSDLDILLLAKEPDTFFEDRSWLAEFGEALATAEEDENLPWAGIRWRVLRVLYSDGRAVDFSILPDAKRAAVLGLNREIHAKGYVVIHDPDGSFARDVARSIAVVPNQQPARLDPSGLERTAEGIVFRAHYAARKLTRGELYAAVVEINGPIAASLLALVEAHTALVVKRTSVLDYEGRFLEDRAEPWVLERLRRCFAPYDALAAADAISSIISLASSLISGFGPASGMDVTAPMFAASTALIERTLEPLRASREPPC